MLELRDRLLRTFIAVFVMFVCMFPFSEQLYLFISEPIRSFLPESSTMIATEVASPFLTPFKLTLILAIYLTMPFILYQLWAFIAPGLYKKEKRVVLPLFFSA